jgi:hypothetical protein
VLRSLQDACLSELLAGLSLTHVRADLLQAGRRWAAIRGCYPSMPDAEFFCTWRRITLLEEGAKRRTQPPVIQAAASLPPRKPPRPSSSQRTTLTPRWAKRETPSPLATLGRYDPASDRRYSNEERSLIADLLGKSRRGERLTDEEFQRLRGETA